VTIHGQRFNPDVRVFFGGQPVTPSSVTPTSITFAVPASSTGGLIQVRYPNMQDLVVGSFEVAQAVAPPVVIPMDTWRDEARRRWAERRALLAATEAARLAALAAQEEARRATRAERRLQRLAAMRAEFEQAFLAEEAAKEELALHAERTARIGRMERVADARIAEDLAVRIGVLMQRETQRHQRRMDDLRAALAAVGGAQ
jgi:hypothetical protein